MKHYTGIGARETPSDILKFMTFIAKFLNTNEYILRSGGARGADTAFEKGSTNTEIYIPWEGFNNHNSSLYGVCEKAEEISEKYHPYWNQLSDPVKKISCKKCVSGSWKNS